MSSKPYSLNFPLKIAQASEHENLSKLNSELNKSFDIFIQSSTNPNELASLKSQTFSVISKWMHAYTQETNKSKKEKERFEQLQKEAAMEWNARHLDLIQQIDRFE